MKYAMWAVLFAVGCNYTDGACYPREDAAGVGGNILPGAGGAGGFGETSATPQREDDGTPPEDCDKIGKKTFVCKGPVRDCTSKKYEDHTLSCKEAIGQGISEGLAADAALDDCEQQLWGKWEAYDWLCLDTSRLKCQ